MATIQIPEWRRAAMLPDNFYSTKEFARRRNLKATTKEEEEIQKEQLRCNSQESNTSSGMTGPTPEISLESLGSDIWFLIYSYIPKSTLISICQTSAHLCSLVIPVLYHTVDLSVHDPPDSVTITFIYRRQTCERQYMFLRQILRKPEYGQYVRSLKWTLGLEDEKLGFRPKYLQDERVMWRTGDRDKVFEYMDKVVSLDIDSAINDGGMMGEGENLFPAAQRVHLRSTSHASSILYGAGKAPLSTLCLGPYSITRPDPSRLTGRTTTPLSGSSTMTHSPLPSKYPNLLHPSFYLRCKNLHTLSLTLQLSDARSEVEDFYTSLAAFLPDIRPRNFIFTLVGMNGQPIPQPFFRHRGEELGTSRKNMQSMRTRNLRWSHVSSITQANIVPVNFRDILLPVLMQGWEGLKRVEIKGVVWNLLGEMRRELKGRGVALAGDGWEDEVDENEEASESCVVEVAKREG